MTIAMTANAVRSKVIAAAVTAGWRAVVEEHHFQRLTGDAADGEELIASAVSRTRNSRENDGRCWSGNATAIPRCAENARPRSARAPAETRAQAGARRRWCQRG